MSQNASLAIIETALRADLAPGHRLGEAAETLEALLASRKPTAEGLVVEALGLVEHYQLGPSRLPHLVNALYDHSKALDLGQMRQLAEDRLDDGPGRTMVRQLTEGAPLPAPAPTGLRGLLADRLARATREADPATSWRLAADDRFRDAVRNALPDLQARGLAPAGVEALTRYANGESATTGGKATIEQDLVTVMKHLQQNQIGINAVPGLVDALYGQRPHLRLDELRALGMGTLSPGTERTLLDVYTETGLSQQSLLTGAVRAAQGLGRLLGLRRGQDETVPAAPAREPRKPTLGA